MDDATPRRKRERLDDPAPAMETEAQRAPRRRYRPTSSAKLKERVKYGREQEELAWERRQEVERQRAQGLFDEESDRRKELVRQERRRRVAEKMRGPDSEAAPVQELEEVDEGEDLRKASNAWDVYLEADEWCRYKGRVTPRHVAEFVRAVDVAWGRTAKARIETGRALQRMKDGLKHTEWITAFKEAGMPFSLRAAQDLMMIARHPMIGNTQNSAYLPNKREPLLLLAKSKLPNTVLDSLMKSGVIHPAMTIKDVEQLAALALPGLINELLAITEKQDAADAAAQAGYQIFRQHKGNAVGVVIAVKLWLEEFCAAFAKLESESRSQWFAQIDAEEEEQEEERQGERLTKAWRGQQSLFRKMRKKKPGSSERYGAPWAGKLKNTERYVRDEYDSRVDSSG
jgi:hypothetical protein